MSECAKCHRNEDVRPPGVGGVCFSCATIAELESENAALKAELVRLSGQTNFCPLCESYAKEISSLKSLLGKERDEFGEKETELKAENYKIAGQANRLNTELNISESRAAKLSELVMSKVAYKFTDPQGNLTELIAMAQEISNA